MISPVMELHLNGHQLTTTKEPDILGVTIDKKLFC